MKFLKNLGLVVFTALSLAVLTWAFGVYTQRIAFHPIPKKDAPDELVLTLAADKEMRIPRADIEDIQPGKVSIMPAGLDKQLSPQELADLIAFLRACK